MIAKLHVLILVVISRNIPQCLNCWDPSHDTYNILQYNTYNTIQYNTIQYNTIQYNTIQYNTIQYNTIQYNTIKLYNTIKDNFCAEFI